MFDYRNFNGSEGEPRNLVSPSRHLQDWRSAVTHVRDLTDIDSSRIALWGTSFSGGHVLVTAARDNGINAAVIQVPFTDGLASAAIYRPHQVLRAAWHGLLDVLSIPLGIQPHYVPMVSLDGEFAVLSTPDARQGYLTLVPENTTWKNQCPARILFTILSYRPTTYAARLTCPTLVVMAEQDSLIPGSSVEAMVRRLRKCEVLRLPIRHFDAYTGDSFETVVKREAEFLRKYLAA
jgi:pimeloyl-ACP methyl ester carboxylesterase